MVFKYCPDCGLKLAAKEIGDEGLVPFCIPCNRGWFSFSYPCVLCVVTNENNEIALIKQSYVNSEYYVGVAGFVKQGETIEDCAKREVEEETGLMISEVKFCRSYYHEKSDSLMFGFVCKSTTSTFNISKEVDEAKWFPADEAVDMLPSGSIIQTLVKEYLYGRKHG